MSETTLRKRLVEIGFYGTLDRLNRNVITQEQAEFELNGGKPDTTILPKRDDLIFGYTENQISMMQGLGGQTTEKSKERTMDKQYIDILTRKFPSLTRSEIEQACLLAELRTGEDDLRLAYRMVQCACLNRLKKERRLQYWFPSYNVDNFPSDILGTDHMMQLMMEEEEWEDVVEHLPRAARKLANIAQDASVEFACQHKGENVWTQHNLSLMRSRIKQRFIDWEWNHSEKAYFKARRILVSALRRNRRKNGGE